MDSWLIFGLGNPGAKYARTRHNVGQWVVDVLAWKGGARFTTHRSRCRVAKLRLGTLPGGAPGPQLIVAASLGYMNLSGGPLAALMRAEGIESDKLLVVHDELDLPLGTLRLKMGGGTGGHNGLKSIREHLGTSEFARLRLGIGRPPGQMDSADYVLREFAKPDAAEMDIVAQEAAEAASDVAARGFAAAQMHLHTT